MDALKALEGTDITISFTGAMRPFVIRPLHDDTTSATDLTCQDVLKMLQKASQ